MQDDEAHSLADPLLHPLDDGIIHTPVGLVPPPQENIGPGEPSLRQAVLKVLQGSDLDRNAVIPG